MTARDFLFLFAGFIGGAAFAFWAAWKLGVGVLKQVLHTTTPTELFNWQKDNPPP